ncbi:MAG TPA: LamG domain-containing protein [Planctomycetota bacterium]|nr:LamG domain-containing protein [Planctomycetota bacterium]
MAGCLLVCAVLVGALSSQDPKEKADAAPVPEPAAGELKDAERIIRLHYKADYLKRKPEDLRAFARVLLAAARDPMNDLASRCVLFHEARETALQAGDPRGVLEAIDDFTRVFVADAPALRKDVVAKIAVPKTVDDARAMVDVCLSLLGESLEAGQYEAAAGYGDKAEAAARNAKDPALLTHVQAAQKEATETLKQYQKIRPLLEKTDDPAACLEVGRFWCFVRENWDAGLPSLAKGTDEKLKDLATRELAAPPLPLRIELGDGWSDLASQERAYRPVLLRHALRNYEQGLTSVTGPGRAKIEARVDGILTELAGQMNRTGLVFWVEPGRSPGDPFRDLASNSKPTNQGATVSDAGGIKSLAFAKTLIQYEVPPPVQAVERNGSVFAWLKCDMPAQWGGIVDRGLIDKGTDIDDFALFINQGYVEAWTNWPARRARVGRSKSTIAAGKWTFIGFTWEEKKITFYIDGKDEGTIVAADAPLRRAARVTVGANPPGGTEWYLGLIGSAMIYNRTLTATDAMGLYQSTRVRFR